MILSSEYDAFQALAEHLARAAEASKSLARHRPDQSGEWNKMAEVLGVCRNSVYKLAEEGLARTIKS
jgi:hypothetical protein